MNIFKKLKYANKVLKIADALKNHFNKNKITDNVRTKVENFINALRDLGTIVPGCTSEVEEIIGIIKKYL